MKIKSFFALLFMFSLFLSGVNARTESAGKVLRHVVMFKFNGSATPANIKKVEDEFAHKEFGKLLGPYLEKVTVIDFWAK